MPQSTGTMLVTAYVSNTSTGWQDQFASTVGVGTDVATYLASADSSTYIRTPAQNSATSFTIVLALGDTPADFVSMLASDFLSTFTLRRNSWVDDSITITWKIATSGGVLLAGKTSGGVFNDLSSFAGLTTSFADYTSRAWVGSEPTYVNETATKAQWDDAQLSITVTNSTTMTFDGSSADFDRIQFDYKYLTTAAPKAPSVFNESVITAITTGNLTTVLSTHAANDILLLITHCWLPNSAASIVAPADPSGWTKMGELFYTPTATGQADAWSAIYWKRAASGAETNPVITRPAGWDTGTDGVWIGRATTIRGCITTGTPYENFNMGGPYTSTAPYSLGNLNGVTVSGPSRLALNFMFGSNSVLDLVVSSPAGWLDWTGSAKATTATGTTAAARTLWAREVDSSISAKSPNGWNGLGFASQATMAMLPIPDPPPNPRIFVPTAALVRAGRW